MQKNGQFFFLNTSEFSKKQIEDMTIEFITNFLNSSKAFSDANRIIANKIFYARMAEPKFFHKCLSFFEIDNKNISFQDAISLIKQKIKIELVSWLLYYPQLFLSDPGRTSLSFSAFYIITSRNLHEYSSFAMFENEKCTTFGGFWIVNPYCSADKNQFQPLSSVFVSKFISQRMKPKTLKIKDITGLIIQHIDEYSPTTNITIQTPILQLFTKRETLKNSIEVKILTLFLKSAIKKNVTKQHMRTKKFTINPVSKIKLNLMNLTNLFSHISSITEFNNGDNTRNEIITNLFFANFYTDEFPLNSAEMLFLLKAVQSINQFGVPILSTSFSYIFQNKNLIDAMLLAKIDLIFDKEQLIKPLTKGAQRHPEYISFFRGLSHNKRHSYELKSFLYNKAKLINKLLFSTNLFKNQKENMNLVHETIIVPILLLQEIGFSETEALHILDTIFDEKIFFFQGNNAFFSTDELSYSHYINFCIQPIKNFLHYLIRNKANQLSNQKEISFFVFQFINDFFKKRIEVDEKALFPMIRIKRYLDAVRTIGFLLNSDSFSKLSFQRAERLMNFYSNHADF